MGAAEDAVPDKDTLPEPLTLEYALSLADQSHPDLELARAGLDRSDATRLGVEAQNGTRIGLEAALRYIEPSREAVSDSRNDSSARLRVRKRLYDFGHSAAELEAADAELNSGRWALLDARQRRRLEIRTSYFDVLLADLEYARDNEAMAVAFVGLEKARDRSELGQLSDIELAETESRFQEVRRRQIQSEARQRATRALLAISINRPDQLSSNLERPTLRELEREISDPARLTQDALAGNPGLKRLRAGIRAAEQRIKTARAKGGPVLHGELGAGVYERTTGSRHPFEAGLVLELPLYHGGTVAADVARERATARALRAGLAQAELEVRRSVLELWSRMQGQKVRLEELDAVQQYRELYLDRSRARYELELSSDLGDSMTQISDYRLQRAEAEFHLSLSWSELDALLGRLIEVENRIPGEEKE
jgi:outer membrane protein TolC